MFEKLFKKQSVRNRFERKLEEAGLPADLKPVGQPITKKIKETGFMVDPELRNLLDRLAQLPEKIQDEIRTELEQEKGLGPQDTGTFWHLKVLIERAEKINLAQKAIGEMAVRKFNDLSEEGNTDRKYHPRSRVEEAPPWAGPGALPKNVDDAIERAEAILGGERGEKTEEKFPKKPN